MLGDDDIGVLIDEPITAADLFGEDEGEVSQIPPLDEDGGGKYKCFPIFIKKKNKIVPSVPCTVPCHGSRDSS